MNRSFFAPVMTITLSLVFWNIGQWFLFQNTLTTLEIQSSQLTSQALGRVLEHAHRMSDDLTLQSALQGLNQAPGVLFACVLDNDNKVLAHTEPTQLGKPFEKIIRRSSHQYLSASILRDAATPWGKLVLSVSQRSARLKTSQNAWLLLAGDCLIVFSLLWLLKKWDFLLHKNKEDSEAIRYRCQELCENVARLTKTQEKSNGLWVAWMQSALEHIPEPAILFDHTQRLLGCNQEACQKMGLPDDTKLRGQSWQEIPELSGLGETLQHSLDRPGEKIGVLSSGSRFEFLSEPANDTLATWVFFK